jgi:hypothetical protein
MNIHNIIALDVVKEVLTKTSKAINKTVFK